MSPILRKIRDRWYRFKRGAAYWGAFLLLKIIDLMLRRMGYRWTSRWLLRLSPSPDPDHEDYTRARLLAIAVDRASVHRVVDVTCLRRSLALWWLMRWLRMPGQVRLAFRMTKGQADGHAWVEHSGRVVNDLPDVANRYTILYHDQLSPETLGRL
ncbi:MAG: lasso peptide biosynthesis B2 protein [Chloroflexi bacterium]|nr:lasso peptide biosynthesis B2 protein [Chloroflexota bacterium]